MKHVRSCLDVMVSCFEDYGTPHNPQQVNLLTWLRSAKYAEQVERIRSLEDKAQRDVLKAKLPAITPSGQFSYRKSENLLQHSGLLQFDIDFADNAHRRDFAKLKTLLCRIKEVAYCGLSVSGRGYWGLVAIANPEKHAQHFDALVKCFARYQIVLDEKPRNVASLRGYAYDREGYFNHHPPRFIGIETPVREQARPFHYSTDDHSKEIDRVEQCISQINARTLDLTTGYDEWFKIGCSLANAFGESGRDYFHQVSQFHPDYEAAATDRQYSSCSRQAYKYSLATFFYLCQQARVTYRDSFEPAPQRVTRPMRTEPMPPLRPECYWKRMSRAGESYQVLMGPDGYPADWD